MRSNTRVASTEERNRNYAGITLSNHRPIFLRRTTQTKITPTTRLATMSHCATRADDPADNLFHVAKIVNITDGKIQLLNYATTTTNIAYAKFQMLYQHSSDGRYRRGGQQSKYWKQVIDEVDVETENIFSYIRHHRLRLSSAGKPENNCRQQA